MFDAGVPAILETPPRTRTSSGLLTPAWPALVLIGAFAVPALLLRVGLAHHDATGLWACGLTLTPYEQLFDRVTGGALLISVALAMACAAICVFAGFALSYAITRMGRRAQVAWLLLLATLTPSEVLIIFSWQVMLSKRGGVSAIFVWLGLMNEPDSLFPAPGAVARPGAGGAHAGGAACARSSPWWCRRRGGRSWPRSSWPPC